MNKSRIKAASKALGRQEFWDSLGSNGTTGSESFSEAAFDDARSLVDFCLTHLFLDKDRHSRMAECRRLASQLSDAQSEINDVRKSISNDTDELKRISLVWAQLQKAELISGEIAESDLSEAFNAQPIKIEFVRQFEFALNSAVKVDDPVEAMKLASLWAFGKRSSSREMLKKCSRDKSEARYWAEQLKGLLEVMEGTSEESDEQAGSDTTAALVSGESDLSDALARLSEVAALDLANLRKVNSLFAKARLPLRKALVRLLFDENRSESDILEAAPSKWTEEAIALRDVLQNPLVTSLDFDALPERIGSSKATATDLSSEYDLALEENVLSGLHGRFSGGNLDRYRLYDFERASFSDHIERTIGVLGPRYQAWDIEALPDVSREVKDVRASLDISRRTAREIVKLRSFIDAAFGREREHISKMVGEVGSIASSPSDFSDLRSTIASMRRDFSQVVKTSGDELSSALTADIVREFLVVVDDLSRIMEIERGGATSGLKEALEMVISRLDGILMRHDVHRIAAVGEIFNPTRHDCVGTKSVENCEKGLILQEVSIGYFIGDRVLRPSKVIVCG